MLGKTLDTSEPRRPAKWACLEAHLPGQFPKRIGVILLESCRDRLHIKIKPYWWDDLVDADEGQIWQSLSEDLSQKAGEMGATIFLGWLKDCCSHSLQIGATRAIQINQPETCLNRLYREHVDQSGITLVVQKRSAASTLSLSSCRPQQSVLTTALHMVSKYHRWTAQGALAATLLFGAWIIGYHSSADLDTHRNIPLISKAIQLPLISEFHYQHVQLNVSFDWQPSRRHRHRRKTHISARIVRPFVIPPRPAKHHDVQIAMVQPPLLPANDATTGELVPPHLLAEPDVPEFHRSHNRFVRILAAVTIPFRFIASR